MLNSTISTPEEVGQQIRQQPVAAVGTTTSSAGLISVVVVCMTILAVCALVYFAIRCYFDERRWRASALLCKCLPPVSSGSFVECGNACRYVERRAFNVQEQATATSVEPAAVSNCRTISDVRMSETKRTGPAFSSPLANNEAVPNWRPPATGSSQRHGTSTSNGNHYRLQKSSQRHKHREQRQAQQRHQRHYQQEQQQQSEQECRNYPLRRSRPFTMPSIRIHSPSSSDSYSNLTMSQKSRAAAMISRDLTAVTFPASDEEDEDRLLRQQYSKSGLSEGHSYGSSTTNLYHPRYNTPVSEIHNNNNNNNTNNDMEVVVNIEDVGATTRTMIEYEDEEAKPDLTRIVSREARAEDAGRKLTKSSGTSPAEDQLTVGGRSVEQSCSTMMVSAADGATSCPTSVDVGWYIDNLKRCQTTRTNSSCYSLNTVSGAALVPLDIARSALPLKGTFPSFEILPGTGGRLITRFTQTDNASVASRASLDWDNYESERLRSETMAEMDFDDMEGSEAYHRLTNVDEGVEGMTTGLSSTTLLMVSHGSNDTTLQASRISQRSASSPYVLCFECSEDFSVNDERRAADNTSYFAPRHTSSSPRPPRRHRLPPTPPALPSLDPSPTSSHHLQPDGQDGRSSKAVKPRRK